jgi:hypothetical protein
MNIIQWLFDDLYPRLPCIGNFADLRDMKNHPSVGNVVKRINEAGKLYPFDILFYHRDAEKNDRDIIKKRKDEILGKIDQQLASKLVCVVPITMMETWLLIDRDAIKKAAGNRNYAGTVDLPALSKLESIKDPKTKLHQTLSMTSGAKGRRLKTLNIHHAVHLVAENIKDYSPLRELSAFREFEKDLKTAVDLFLQNVTI